MNNYSVCTAWGKHEKFFYLLDVFRRRMEYPDLKRKAIELAGLHGAHTVLIEDKASGTQLIQELSRTGMDGVKAYEPSDNDKYMRMVAQTVVFENGRVLLPKEASWLGEYIKELTGFPGAKYDDQVDSTAQALDWLQNHSSNGFFSSDWKLPERPTQPRFRDPMQFGFRNPLFG